MGVGDIHLRFSTICQDKKGTISATGDPSLQMKVFLVVTVRGSVICNLVVTARSALGSKNVLLCLGSDGGDDSIMIHDGHMIW